MRESKKHSSTWFCAVVLLECARGERTSLFLTPVLELPPPPARTTDESDVNAIE